MHLAMWLPDQSTQEASQHLSTLVCIYGKGRSLSLMRMGVRQHEPLARHAAFGVGGPADVWLSLASKEELLDLVRLCAQEHWPLLVVGNGTNILFADAGVRGIVAHIALAGYRIEERSDGSALLLAEAGVS